MKVSPSLLALCALFPAAAAFADHPLSNEKILCTVTDVEGSTHSFIPPERGDTLTIDLAVDDISGRIRFQRNGDDRPYISLSPLKTRSMKKIPPQGAWDRHIAVYEGSEIDWSDRGGKGAQYAFRLQVGDYTDGYAAAIQILSREPRLGWTVSNVSMTCKEL